LQSTSQCAPVAPQHAHTYDAGARVSVWLKQATCHIFSFSAGRSDAAAGDVDGSTISSSVRTAVVAVVGVGADVEAAKVEEEEDEFGCCGSVPTKRTAFRNLPVLRNTLVV